MSTTTGPLALPLIGSGVGRAGGNFVTHVQQNFLQPKISTKPPATFLASESATMPLDATMVFGQTAAVMHRGGFAVKASRQVTLQAQNFSDTIDQLATQLGNDLIDTGVLSGSGASGNPLGLLNNSAILATSGASMNMSGLSSMEENAVANDASDSGLTWMASTDVRRILRQRELNSGSGSLWPGATLLGHQTITTSKMPAASLLLGDFSHLDVLLFGNCVEVLVDPFSNFQSGMVTFQLSVAVDYVLNYPAAFRKSVNVT